MMPRNVLAIALIAIGLLAFAYQGITYTTRHKAVDLGPIQVTTERTRTIPISPIVGALALAGGIALVVMNKRTA
jgi:hypothetical protein